MARFREQATLDPSQVRDRRGAGGRGGSGMAIGGVGGGLGLIILIVTLLRGGNPLDTGGTSNPGAVDNAPTGTESSLAEDCQTGADANESQDCRIVGFVNSIQAYWTDEYAANNARYVEAPAN
ncbi:MAG TPA: neutral zinc metallopeptidase, partial [Thermomicrobiales bacterium]|nr:neutral zinc metallopeptidase [Thermomicrobiales bacterium]